MYQPLSRPRLSHPAIPQTVGWGIALAAVAACISGLSIWLNAFAVKQVPDAAVYTSLKNAVAVGVLLVLVRQVVTRDDLRSLDRTRWLLLMGVGAFGGGLAFLLFFSGLAAASAPSAAFLQKTLFVWVAVLAVPFLGERLGAGQLAALAILVVGQVVILPPRDINWGQGETMILLATLIWSVEVVVVRRYLRNLAAPIVGAGRLGFGLVALGCFVVVTGRAGGVASLPAEAWLWTILTGFTLAGYVLAWFGALRRAPASAVTSVLVGGAIITGGLQAVAKGGAPALDLTLGYLAIAVGVAATCVVARRASGQMQLARSAMTARRV